MKLTRIFMITLFVALSCMWVSGKDLYVYSLKVEKPLHELKNIQKITFIDTKMSVISVDGSKTDINVSDFDFFSFTPKSTLTSLSEIKDNGISISFDGTDRVDIQSESILSSVELFSIQGSAMQKFVPMVGDLNFSMSSYPAGIYLMKIVSGEKETTHKIIKR